MTFPDEFAPAPVVLIRNNGDGTFTDITVEAKIAIAAHAVAIVPTDFDNHRDVDLLVVRHDAAPILLKNLRDGSFSDVAAAVGLTSAAASGTGFTAVAAGDVNKDGYPDFYLGRAQGPGVLALSDRGRFVITPAPVAAHSAAAAVFVDYDNDGLLDLLTWSADGPHVARNLGTSWSDETASALAGSGSRTFSIASSRALGVADLDGDGRDDFLALSSDGAATQWRTDATATNRSIRVRLKGRVSNRFGRGVKSPDSRREPRATPRGVSQHTSCRPRRPDFRTWQSRRRGRHPCGVAVWRRAGRNRRSHGGRQPGAGFAPAARRHRGRRGAQSQTVLMSFLVHLERRPLPIRDRFPRRR